jgi:hypothetical protein
MVGSRLAIVFRSIAAAIAAVVVWEIALEIGVVRRPGYLTHPELGRIYKKGLYVHGTEGYSRTHINSLGMREAWEPMQKKDPSVERILFLGDSYTEALQCSDGKIFPDLVEKMMGKPAQSINAGRSGGSPAFYIHLRKFYEQTVAPDYVIVQLNDGDFLEDAFRADRNYYVVEEGGSFKAVYNANFSSANPLMQKLGRLRGLLEFSSVAVGAESAQYLIRSINTQKKPKELPPANAPDPELLRRSIRWTVAELKRYPNATVLHIPAVHYKTPDEEPSFVEKELESACREEGVPFLDMRRAFVQHYKQTREVAHGFSNTQPGVGHINELGHRLTAIELVKLLTEVTRQ